jgi:hypothetical protein
MFVVPKVLPTAASEIRQLETFTKINLKQPVEIHDNNSKGKELIRIIVKYKKSNEFVLTRFGQ